jgi:hypothetical protein
MHVNDHARHLALRAALVCALSALGIGALPAVATATTTGISGTVTEAEAPQAGIEGASVCLYSASFTFIECKTDATSASGEYLIEPKEGAGEYRVGFNATGFVPQYWDDVSSVFESTPVTVKTSEVTEDINAELVVEGEGSVTGQATNASNGQGAGGVEVCIDDRCVETNGNGEYTISGIAVGSYTISFSPAETCEEEQGEKVRCQPKSNYLRQSSSAKIKANQTETVNVALQPGGQISGTVTSASITSPGLAKIEVCASKVSGSEEYGRSGCAYTNSSGQYTISGLEGGSYKLEFNGYICSIPKKGEQECPEVYITTYYHGKQTQKASETISVTLGQTTSGINESLREAFPTTPASTAAPALTGTPVVGQALSCSQGSWSHEPTYVVYQWLRNGTVISGQTGSTYTLQAADQGRSITCSVSAGNGAGAASATSNAVTVPVPLAVFVSAKAKGALQLITLRCPGPGACSGTVKLVARVTTGRGKRRKTSNVTIGSARFSIVAGKSVTLGVRVTGQGPKLLIKSRRRGLEVQITGTGIKAAAATLKAPKVAKRKKRKK